MKEAIKTATVGVFHWAIAAFIAGTIAYMFFAGRTEDKHPPCSSKPCYQQLEKKVFMLTRLVSDLHADLDELRKDLDDKSKRGKEM